MADDITKYDKTEVYGQIEPLVKEILTICAKENIPMAVSFALKNDEKGTVYKNEAFMPVSGGIRLKNDYITQVLLAVNGGKFIPPSRTEGMNFEADPDDDHDYDLGEAFQDAVPGLIIDDVLPVQMGTPVEEKPAKKKGGRPPKVKSMEKVTKSKK